MSDKEIRDLPTADQLNQELKRLRNKSSFTKAVFSTVSGLIVMAAIAVIISTMMLPVLRVTGSSMNPTLRNDEMILCVKSSNYDRGEIVAFYYNNKILLKRVIGLPGEKINILEDGTVYIDDKVLDEPYVTEPALGEADMTFPYQVPEGRIFVIGDNRPLSVDSRSTTIGAISTELIVGKVKYVIYPFNSFGKVK